MKKTIVAISLLVALIGFFLPVKTVAKPFVFSKQNKQIELQKESVIYKTDAPIQSHKPDNGQNNKHLEKQKPKPTTKAPAGRVHSGRNYPAATADKEAIKALIIKYSEQYGINPQVPLCIAYHESSYNSQSKNKSSSASGVFQYLNGTWKATDEGKAGYSVFDADANIKAAIKYMSSRRSTAPWEVRNKCPKL